MMTPQAQEILDRPILIVGAPRSGTTWVQRLLLGHPAVRGGQESDFFTLFTPALSVFQDDGARHRFIGLDNYWTAEALREEIRTLWRKTMLPMVQSDTRLLIEKSPDHAMVMSEVHQLLPAAKFIHVIRDSRAVAASLMAASRDSWGRGWTSGKAKEAALRWWRAVRAARRSGAALPPASYMEVFYEDLTRDGVTQLDRMFQFIGIDVGQPDLARIVDEQRFDKQKAIGGTPFQRSGELAQKGVTILKEPAGFFRKGEAGGWKKELSLFQQLVIWRYTRHLMRECGYDWNGNHRHNERESSAAPNPSQPAATASLS